MVGLTKDSIQRIRCTPGYCKVVCDPLCGKNLSWVGFEVYLLPPAWLPRDKETLSDLSCYTSRKSQRTQLWCLAHETHRGNGVYRAIRAGQQEYNWVIRVSYTKCHRKFYPGKTENGPDKTVRAIPPRLNDLLLRKNGRRGGACGTWNSTFRKCF